MKYSDLTTIDSDILNGTPVFKGTRVPAESLFWHLEQGISLSDFLDDFPTVAREQAMHLLHLSGKLFFTEKFMKLLLDENLPKKLTLLFTEHEVFTVREMMWNGIKNGALLNLMIENNFRALLSFDQNITPSTKLPKVFLSGIYFSGFHKYV